MTVQPDGPVDGGATAIPHTINDIGDALTGGDRARFYGQVLAAEAAEVPEVMHRWWKTAMLNAAPQADRSRANAAAGRALIPLSTLAARVEGVQ
ncbi:hypothetical protein [Streptomyces odontomachi]|uniref:hypothetical protein n=1 Tax=Streptomyces odontomachi TaxID=2944940 RepID=UPI002108A6F9|nr:hypothetical protein [Streptomyces sp. ODS25]